VGMKKHGEVVRRIVEQVAKEHQMGVGELRFARKAGVGYRLLKLGKKQDQVLRVVMEKASLAMPELTQGQIQDVLAQVINGE
jgi:hypothetical protein